MTSLEKKSQLWLWSHSFSKQVESSCTRRKDLQSHWKPSGHHHVRARLIYLVSKQSVLSCDYTREIVGSSFLRSLCLAVLAGRPSRGYWMVVRVVSSRKLTYDSYSSWMSLTLCWFVFASTESKNMSAVGKQRTNKRALRTL